MNQHVFISKPYHMKSEDYYADGSVFISTDDIGSIHLIMKDSLLCLIFSFVRIWNSLHKTCLRYFFSTLQYSILYVQGP